LSALDASRQLKAAIRSTRKNVQHVFPLAMRHLLLSTAGDADKYSRVSSPAGQLAGLSSQTTTFSHQPSANSFQLFWSFYILGAERRSERLVEFLHFR
ncbi:MAG TPA: hypothetical protein VGL91_01335, partial [Acidobacteriota bacterium]